jgi:hypothetical protein
MNCPITMLHTFSFDLISSKISDRPYDDEMTDDLTENEKKQLQIYINT